MAEARPITMTGGLEVLDIEDVMGRLACYGHAPTPKSGFEAVRAHRVAYQAYESAAFMTDHAERKSKVIRDENVAIFAHEEERRMGVADACWDAILAYTPSSFQEAALIAAYVYAHWQETDPVGGDWMLVELARSWATRAGQVDGRGRAAA